MYTSELVGLAGWLGHVLLLGMEKAQEHEQKQAKKAQTLVLPTDMAKTSYMMMWFECVIQRFMCWKLGPQLRGRRTYNSCSLEEGIRSLKHHPWKRLMRFSRDPGKLL